MSVFSPLFTSLGSLLTHLADALDPVLGASATAGAIVVFTCAVRLALHPLTRSAVRGGRRRAELAPRLAELKRKHGKNPERLQQEIAELYRKEDTSPLAGCLPMLVQLPVFYVMYHLFSTGDGGGDLLKHTLLGAPLGGRWADALGDGGLVGAQGLVYLGLFALVGAVATWTFLRNRKAAGDLPVPGAEDVQVPGMAAMAKVLPLLSFGTLVTAAVVPLAAGLYLVTTTTWSAVERAYLQPLGKAEKQAEPEGERQAAGKAQAVGKRRSSAA
ncbi:YidC/Oxa1 family membrane protein insertase [Streptomyces cinnamoneus]|uniref:Membrane protein insertase YidC n=1 Tax=Streptomyces cinnamoneus TaxID=53446 RepID=A0A918TXR3_STRCJ|nr:YidC/Oxa1 family membrane protein insertase [Streptomyces cinnamoneus]GHC65071.1 membrane protein [Streptomyces cinnamoneus]